MTKSGLASSAAVETGLAAEPLVEQELAEPAATDQSLPLPRRTLSPSEVADPARLAALEWLVTNGLGGYAAGTVAGVLTRRYHGLLVAALPPPHGRVVTLNRLAETVHLPDGTEARLWTEEREEAPAELLTLPALADFHLEGGLPVWTFRGAGWALEKRLVLPHGQNTVLVLYHLLEAPGPVRLQLEPAVQFRPQEEAVTTPLPEPFAVGAAEGRCEVGAAGGLPPLRMALVGGAPQFATGGRRIAGLHYRVEASRGYAALGDAWSPGTFAVELAPGEEVTLAASTEPWETVLALAPREALQLELERRVRLLAAADPRAHGTAAAELVLAADQFLITPPRAADAVRAHASGDEPRTVIAGYHWFTDWGRDTMISLEGLALATGRLDEARYVLRTFAGHVRDGLIPNLIPEGQRQGLYHTADATLWFFHAIDRYVAASGDHATLEALLPALLDIVEHHLRGTRFGIGVDPFDGLLRQGAPGYQLTWMDAKVEGWVVTPRRGKAVEINALWYNALRLLEGWVRDMLGEEAARPLAGEAERVWRGFNARFWYAEGGYLYDVVDSEEGGDDPACRPNQVLAISLAHPVLARERWPQVLAVVRERLLTPVGLRSLAPGHPDYKPAYDGDLRARDAAYHQGTVWGWLLGPLIDAWLKLHPLDRPVAREWLEGALPHLGDACLGTISEIFDAEPPYRARGCVAQAWSVAELLRCWLKTTE